VPDWRASMKKCVFCCVLMLLTAPRASAGIINGNFEAGNTGFSTAYTYSPGNIGAQQSYDILHNPSTAHPSATSYGDHTTGSGLMLAINGSTTANQLIWAQTVAVDPNATYTFSAWISSWVSAAPGQVDVLFNGVSIGTMNAPSTTAVWTPFSATWNSGAATSVNIELRNLSTADVGNDFAIDDLSLSGGPAAVPEPSSLLLAASACGLLG